MQKIRTYHNDGLPPEVWLRVITLFPAADGKFIAQRQDCLSAIVSPTLYRTLHALCNRVKALQAAKARVISEEAKAERISPPCWVHEHAGLFL